MTRSRSTLLHRNTRQPLGLLRPAVFALAITAAGASRPATLRAQSAQAQAATPGQSPSEKTDAAATRQGQLPTPTAWYAKFRIRGYGQVRYNRLLETNPQFQCEQCDRSWGENGGFFIRRARIILQGQIHPQVFMYLQPDFASTAGTTGNIAQLRDWYVDVGIDKANEFRFRVGQSKIPFGYENMQSSSNRLPLDRADGTNSAHSNERDLGVFFMWAP